MDIRSDSSVCFVCVCVVTQMETFVNIKGIIYSQNLNYVIIYSPLFSSTYMAYFLQQNPKEDLKQNNTIKRNKTNQTETSWNKTKRCNMALLYH